MEGAPPASPLSEADPLDGIDTSLLGASPTRTDEGLRRRASRRGDGGLSTPPPEREHQELQEDEGPEGKLERDEEDEVLCRICLGGEDAELGRMITPCKCRGTMAKVHVQCLTRWRHSAPNSSSFFQCDHCKYRYRFRRTAWASLCQSRLALLSLSSLVFLALVALCGFFASWFISLTASSTFLNSAGAPFSFSIGGGDLVAYYYQPQPVLLTTGLRTAVKGLGRGLGVDVEQLVPDLEPGRPEEDWVAVAPEDQRADDAPWWKRLFGLQSPRPAQRGQKRPSMFIEAQGELQQSEQDGGDAETGYRFVSQRSVRREQEADATGYRLKRNPRAPSTRKADPPLSQRVAAHFILGFSFLSLLSVAQFLITPLTQMPFLGRRRNAADGFAGVFMVVIVLIGAAKAFYSTWRGTKQLVRWGLSRVEDAILEVR